MRTTTITIRRVLLFGVTVIGQSVDTDDPAIAIDRFIEQTKGGFQNWIDYALPDGTTDITQIEGVTVDPVTNIADFSNVISIRQDIADRLDINALAITAASNNPGIDNDRRQELERQYSNSFRNVLGTCVTVMGAGVALQELKQAATSAWLPDAPNGVSNDDITVGGVIKQDGQPNRHVCEFIPIYLPGTRTASAASNPIGQATLHIGEAQGIFEFPNWEDPWAGPTQTADFNEMNNPSATWFVINRAPSDGDRGWLISPRRGLNCRGTGTPPDGTACDEFPWSASVQGGGSAVPTPHLRIIDTRHNSNSGREWAGVGSQTGAIACGVGNNGAAVIVAPHPLSALLNLAPDQFAAESTEFADIKSESICPLRNG